MKLAGGGALKPAQGNNQNHFYQVPVLSEIKISPKAILATSQLKETWLYDIDTQAGKTYTLVGF